MDKNQAIITADTIKNENIFMQQNVYFQPRVINRTDTFLKLPHS